MGGGLDQATRLQPIHAKGDMVPLDGGIQDKRPPCRDPRKTLSGVTIVLGSHAIDDLTRPEENCILPKRITHFQSPQSSSETSPAPPAGAESTRRSTSAAPASPDSRCHARRGERRSARRCGLGGAWRPSRPTLHHGFDECLRKRGDDRIAVGAQSSHAGGSPINQRLNAGFNWPPTSIPAEEPVSISPEAVSRAGPSVTVSQAVRPSRALIGTFRHSGPSFQSRVVGVGQPANATVLRLLSLFPAGLY